MVRKKYINRQILSALLSTVMVFTSIPNTYIYADTQKDILPEYVSEGQTENMQVYTLKKKGEVSEYGYQDMVWVDENGNEAEPNKSYEKYDSELSRSSNIQLPTRYSMLDEGLLPAVRDQGKWGTCWAHAAISSLETNMIKKGLEDKSKADYSERHLSYFGHRRNTLFGDGADVYDSVYEWYSGGNYLSSVFQLASWYGAASESKYPYSAYGDMGDLDESMRSDSVCHMTDASRLYTWEEVKSAIMKNGSIICSFHTDDESTDFNNYAVYHSEVLDTNHLVSIVGWDDEYKASNFSGSANGSTPDSDGAWLCRNSWGEYWGNNGYFWISYEDATLGWFCSLEAEAADNYDNIYQYDGAGYNSILPPVPYLKSANIFTSKSVEELRAVSFYTFDSCDYIIDIFVGDSSMNSPSDGELVYSQEGTMDTEGYHTVRLNNSVILDKGEKYAVSVQYISKEDAVCYPYTFVETGDMYSSEAGQSYLYLKEPTAYDDYGNPIYAAAEDDDTGEWYDTANLPEYIEDDIKNVCIKAFTDNLGNIDKSCLEPVIAKAEEVNTSEYTEESVKQLAAKLENARAVYNSTNPSVSEIVTSKAELESALSNLVPLNAANRFKVVFPDIKGVEISSCTGYESTGIQKGGSYLFTVKAENGYDISDITIKQGENVLIPSDGVYRIDNIISDIDNISISGIKLGSGNYYINGHADYNGYVGEKAVVTPALPAVKIKLSGERDFAESITVDTDKAINVILCDEDGNTGSEEQITFKRDITEPKIDSVTVPFVDEVKQYKGILITVNASDSESGVSEYSFDGGETWQKDNGYKVMCAETETTFDKGILVRDDVGNVAEYTGVVNIPAVAKCDVTVDIDSDKKSYIYGTDIILTANINFGEYESDCYGTVSFFADDGYNLGTSDVKPTIDNKGSAEISIPVSEYGSVGEKSYKAVYNGDGTPYRNCESEKYSINVEKAVVASVNTDIQSSKTISASDNYNEMQIRELIDVNQVEVTANTGDIYNLSVTWETSDKYNVKGGIYNFAGTIYGDEYVEVPEGMTLNTKIIVTPVLMKNPVLPDIEVEQRDVIAAGANELGSQILPVSGIIDDIRYNIIWNRQQTIDLTSIGNQMKFEGTISYENIPKWVTMPETLNITRNVKVIKSDNIGTVIKLSSQSKSYVYGESVVFSANVSAIGNTPVMPDSDNSYGKVYLYIYDENGKEQLAGYAELDASLKAVIKVGRTSGKYKGYESVGQKKFYAVYEYDGRRQSLWSSTSDSVKVNILKEIQKPAKPSSFTLIKITKNSARIKWSRVKGAAGYEIYRKTGSGSYKKYKTIQGGKNVTFVDKGLSKTGTYYYKVKAYVNGYGTKVYSTFSAAKGLEMSKSLSSDELKISASKVKLKVNKSKTIKVIYPKGRSKSDIKSIKYKSDKSSVAKVSSKGKITAKKKGTANIAITVKLKNGQTKILKTKVTVTK